MPTSTEVRKPQDDSQNGNEDEGKSRGEQIIRDQQAKGEPGQKQPAHKDHRVRAEEAVKAIEEVEKKYAAETYGPSDERAKQPGNLNPIPPHERTLARGPQATAPIDAAAGHLSAARTAITQQYESEARLKSDPRHERDQKIYELGQQGKLGFVPPSEAEVAAQAAKSGLPPEVADRLPKTPQEQAEQDMVRLNKAEEISKEINPTIRLSEERAKISSGTSSKDSKDQSSTASEDKKDYESMTKAELEEEAARQGITPAEVEGTGANGTVVKDDLIKALNNKSGTSSGSSDKMKEPIK